MARIRRQAYSLIEVLLAISIFVASLLALGRLVGLGRIQLEKDDELTTAQLLADSTMNDLATGAMPVVATQWTAFVRYPQWSYAIEIIELPWPEFVAVQLRVARQATSNNAAALGALNAVPTGKEFTLVRWFRANQVSTSTDFAEDTPSDSIDASPSDSMFDGSGGP